MRTIKSLLTVALLGLSLASLVVEAAQPVVWTANITNDLAAGAVGATTTAVIPANAAAFTSGGGSTAGVLDTLLQTQISVIASVKPNGVGASTGNGTYILNSMVSDDLLVWVPGPQTTIPVCTTNTIDGLTTNITAVAFRYIVFTNFTYTATNSFVTNADVHVKVMFKGN